MSLNILKFKNNTEFFKFLEEEDVQFIDLNFTGLTGKLHHLTRHVSAFNKEHIQKGVYFDVATILGASMEGKVKAKAKAKAILKPDMTKVVFDPFSAQRTLKIFCDIYDATTNEPCHFDPRGVARTAEKYLSSTKIADTAFFGSALEFFIFENTKIDMQPYKTGVEIESESPPRASRTDSAFSETPTDNSADIRGEMLSVLRNMGIDIERHQHKSAPNQCELGMAYSTLTNAADHTQIYKHVVHNVANAYGKTATFMPKPLCDHEGSAMFVHQSLWKDSAPLFAGQGYEGLSETALYYIGGILHHARTLNAFTNPTTNSYKRLLPDGGAPTQRAYSAQSKAAACRIPYTNEPHGKRMEARFSDPCANPYLAYAAMMMAGLDGIENKINPGEPMDASPSAPFCTSLREALEALRKSHDFLLKGDVFTVDIIDAYIAIKTKEIELCERSIHPAEYHLYYQS